MKTNTVLNKLTVAAPTDEWLLIADLVQDLSGIAKPGIAVRCSIDEYTATFNRK